MNTLIPFDIEAQKQAAAKAVEGIQVQTLMLVAKRIEVIDEDSYAQAIDLRSRFADAEKRIANFWDPLVKAANSLHKLMTGARAEMQAPYVEGKAIVTKKAEDFLAARKRAQRQAQEALERAAEQQRRQLEQEAKRLALRGEMDRAEEISMQAQMSMAPTLPPMAPTVAGARTADKFKATTTDIMAVMAHILGGEFPLMNEVKPGDYRPLVVVDQVVLNALVNRMGDGLKIPGIKVEELTKISSTGR